MLSLYSDTLGPLAYLPGLPHVLIENGIAPVQKYLFYALTFSVFFHGAEVNAAAIMAIYNIPEIVIKTKVKLLLFC